MCYVLSVAAIRSLFFSHLSIQSILRVGFHERRMRFMEQEHLEYWQQTRPGERLLDIGEFGRLKFFFHSDSPPRQIANGYLRIILLKKVKKKGEAKPRLSQLLCSQVPICSLTS